ncbi:hypothetical protein Tco_1531964 [Tanacetum coccineum]|uniref:Uncharacterized protein n=1 Tax=Tanacetum coccineum TaxID=301880 RepID=A0ABQ5B1E1_9ASTR
MLSNLSLNSHIPVAVMILLWRRLLFLDDARLIPPGIESDDVDSVDDDTSIFLPEFESFYVDYPNSGNSTIDVVEDIQVECAKIDWSVPIPCFHVVVIVQIARIVKTLSICLSSRGSGYKQKDRKPSQNDKTEHGMEKTVQNQGQRPIMPKSES